MLKIAATQPRAISDSDYGTATCSDDEAKSLGSERNSGFGLPQLKTPLPQRYPTASGRTRRAGICPHCSKPFVKPLVLPCGHSLCSECNAKLLAAANGRRNTKRHRIRMGVSVARLTLAPSTSSIEESLAPPEYKSPECPECGEGPSLVAPFANAEVERLLSYAAYLAAAEFQQQQTSFHYEHENSDIIIDADSNLIKECFIAVLGAPKVGKTTITRVQYGNELVINGNECSDIVLDILDTVDLERNISRAHGAMIVYSVADADSLLMAELLLEQVRSTRPQLPAIVVGSKSDVARRAVSREQGQALAARAALPFTEVSARRNDGVNEAFCELLRRINSTERR